MSDNKGTPDGEHIEELLSQLKGIFGHLSETEKEEVKQKITPPVSSPRISSSPPSPEPAIREPEPASPEPVAPEMPGEPPAEPDGLPSLEPWVPGEQPAPLPSPEGFTPNQLEIPAGASLIPTTIFYPAGRINDAKIVAEKVERITPKFTKVTVIVNVQTLAAYDAKTDLKTTVLTHIANSPTKAVFVLIDKSLDETRRKALIAELEPRGIYFQEIPSHQVEKKAIYTDMLLGMVFFFDSQKPAPEEPTT